MSLRHRLELQSAARTQRQHMPALGNMLGQQQPGHAMEAVHTGHEAARAVGIVRDRFGVFEMVEEILDGFSHEQGPCRQWGRGETRVEFVGERGQRHPFEPCEQQRLCLAKACLEGCVHGLFDEAVGRIVAIPHCDQRRTADRTIDVGQADRGQVSRDRPSPPCPFSECTSPASRSPPSRRRTTTGLVRIAFASCSDVRGSPASAMWSKMWRTPERRLSRFM